MNIRMVEGDGWLAMCGWRAVVCGHMVTLALTLHFVQLFPRYRGSQHFERCQPGSHGAAFIIVCRDSGAVGNLKVL